MNDAKVILLKILEIIGYSEDKDKFATEFLQNVSLQALLDLFNTLPVDQKDQIHQQITSAGNNPQAIQEALKTYFTDSQLQEAIKNSAKNAVTEYIKTIETTLSDSQTQNLTNYFGEITKHTSPAAV